MIDFRYHIVSIVSIFMALAVGIVLGAGPLEGELVAMLPELARIFAGFCRVDWLSRPDP